MHAITNELIFNVLYQMGQQLSGLKTGIMPAMTQSAWSWGGCVCLWQSRFMGLKHRQTFLGLLCALQSYQFFCKSQATSALYGRLSLVLVKANARALLSRSLATAPHLLHPNVLVFV